MRTTFNTLNGRLNMQSPPMLLWQKAKKYGVWNPSDIDFSQDIKDYEALTEAEQEFICQLIGQFQAGEEAVTLDLLPLIMTVAKEGRLEEEMFLTSFLWEEAKHVEGFNRILAEVATNAGDLNRFITPSYKKIFYEILPNTLDKLLEDASPVNQARASVTYNMIIEGVMAETGYFSFYKILDTHQIMPGIREFVGKLKQDESRHIAYGIFLLSRLVAENGKEVWQAIEEQMNLMMQTFMMQTQEVYAGFGDHVPFGFSLEESTAYSMDQFQKRWARIERARTQSIEEIYKIAKEDEVSV